jgi:hypothetical protein
LKIAHVFEHRCCFVAKLGHVFARDLTVLSDSACQGAKIVGDFIGAADNLIGGLSNLVTSHQTNLIDSSYGSGSEAQISRR